MGGRYLRKRRPGVSNMRQHSPPHTLHLSIWPLSELISWQIKTNRRDPVASGCLRRTLPRLLSPPGLGLTDKGHCVGHLHCHTPHLPCQAVRFDEVIWQQEHDLNLQQQSTLEMTVLCSKLEKLNSHYCIIIHKIFLPFSLDHYDNAT